MKCVNCGADSDDKYRFCQYCGTSMPSANSTVVITNVYTGPQNEKRNPIDDVNSIFDQNYMTINDLRFDLNLVIRTYGKSKIGAISWLRTNAKLTKEEAHRLLDQYYTNFEKNINNLSFFDGLKANTRLMQEYK